MAPTEKAAGCGGYGDPPARPVAKVVEEIKDEYVSPAAAGEPYGVVVKEIDRRPPAYEVDAAATQALREQMRASRRQG